MIIEDSPSPIDVVRGFIAAMYSWEQEAHSLAKAARDANDPASYWPEVQDRLQEVYRRFCTRRDRPYGRNGSYSVPPEYDPDTEHIIEVISISARRVHVITQQGKGFRNRCQYVVARVGGAWRIDNRRILLEDGTSITNTL